MSDTQFMSESLRPGELYAGLLLGMGTQPNQHIFLLPGSAGKKLTWHEAKEWAAKAGGELPTRREQSLLFANLQEAFQPAWYWSGEQHETFPEHAWGHNFLNGLQGGDHVYSIARARAVRRSAA
ncbi:DUF1566 domain-containing protein [Oxalobacteraceae bacterium A2-2]